MYRDTDYLIRCGKFIEMSITLEQIFFVIFDLVNYQILQNDL